MANGKKKHNEWQYETYKITKITDGITKVLNTLIQYGSVVFIFRYIYLSINSLAGRETFANIKVDWKTVIDIIKESGDLSPFLYWGIIIFSVLTLFGSIIYGWNQRSLRISNIERMESHIRYLEKIIDRDRSSSRLTPQGTTSPKDV